MPALNVENGPGYYRFTWPEIKLVADITRVREHRDGDTDAELLLQSAMPGGPEFLYRGRYTLTGGTSRKNLISGLTKDHNYVNWAEIVHTISEHVLEYTRYGEAEEDVTTNDEIVPPKYALFPILPERRPTIIFGKRSAGKSLVGLVYGICLQLPWRDNPLGLKTADEMMNVLYLDYETERDEIAWRMKCLQKGMGLPYVGITYRRCTTPLADDAERIQHIVKRRNIGIVIVDSLFAAAGGDLKEGEPARQLFGALRGLNVTSLLIGQTAKGSGQDGKESSVYGAVFFEYEGRSIWEIRKTQESGRNEIELGLFHTKASNGGLALPLGYRVQFGPDWTQIRRKDVEDMEELNKSLSVRIRIRHVLRSGPWDARALAERLDESEPTIRKALYRMRDRSEVVQVGDKWALAQEDETTPATVARQPATSRATCRATAP